MKRDEPQEHDILHYSGAPTATVTGIGPDAPQYAIGEHVPHLVMVPRTLTPHLLTLAIHSPHERDSRYVVPTFPYRYATPAEVEDYLAACPAAEAAYRAQTTRPLTADQRIAALEEQKRQAEARAQQLEAELARARAGAVAQAVAENDGEAVRAAQAESPDGSHWQEPATEEKPARRPRRGGTVTSADVAGAQPQG